MAAQGTTQMDAVNTVSKLSTQKLPTLFGQSCQRTVPLMVLEELAGCDAWEFELAELLVMG